MPHLSPEQQAAFARDGFLFPLPVLGAADVATLRARVEAIAADEDAEVRSFLHNKGHMVLTWMDALVHHPAILDAVEGVLGPDLLCWEANHFIKQPGDKRFVSWHQDINYWGLQPADVASAWVALSPVTIANGCMRFLPGSHRGPVYRHVETFHADNMLSRGQRVEAEIDPERTVAVELQPGEMALFHVGLLHGSGANQGSEPRMGVAIRYMAPHVRQTLGAGDTAMLVRGQDRHHHFIHEPQPPRDRDPEAVALRRAYARRHAEILMQGAGHPGG